MTLLGGQCVGCLERQPCWLGQCGGNVSDHVVFHQLLHSLKIVVIVGAPYPYLVQ